MQLSPDSKVISRAQMMEELRKPIEKPMPMQGTAKAACEKLASLLPLCHQLPTLLLRLMRMLREYPPLLET